MCDSPLPLHCSAFISHFCSLGLRHLLDPVAVPHLSKLVLTNRPCNSCSLYLQCTVPRCVGLAMSQLGVSSVERPLDQSIQRESLFLCLIFRFIPPPFFLSSHCTYHPLPCLLWLLMCVYQSMSVLSLMTCKIRYSFPTCNCCLTRQMKCTR